MTDEPMPKRYYDDASAHQLNVYRDALADIEGILRTPEWSQGMLEDIAAIVKRTGVKHNSPPPYNHH